MAPFDMIRGYFPERISKKGSEQVGIRNQTLRLLTEEFLNVATLWLLGKEGTEQILQNKLKSSNDVWTMHSLTLVSQHKTYTASDKNSAKLIMMKTPFGDLKAGTIGGTLGIRTLNTSMLLQNHVWPETEFFLLRMMQELFTIKFRHWKNCRGVF